MCLDDNLSGISSNKRNHSGLRYTGVSLGPSHGRGRGGCTLPDGRRALGDAPVAGHGRVSHLLVIDHGSVTHFAAKAVV